MNYFSKVDDYSYSLIKNLYHTLLIERSMNVLHVKSVVLLNHFSTYGTEVVSA